MLFVWGFIAGVGVCILCSRFVKVVRSESPPATQDQPPAPAEPASEIDPVTAYAAARNRSPRLGTLVYDD